MLIPEKLEDGRVAIKILEEDDYDDETRFIAAIEQLARWFAIKSHISHTGVCYDYLSARWGKDAMKNMDNN